ncbi:MAG: thioredoxin [Acholeplasmatales bacterium]|jgi:thioredoxin 1|nr:thioredoxin [Acholeplasmatales bacterium]
MLIHIENNIFDEVLSAKTAIVDFWAPWCGPCRTMGPIFEEFSDELEDESIVVAKVDVDKNMELAKKYGINTIPSICIFKNGKALKKVVGVQSKNKLFELVK